VLANERSDLESRNEQLSMEIAKSKNSLNVMEELLMKTIQGSAEVPGDFNAI